MSLKAGELQRVLQKKMAAAAAKHLDPHKSCIRIGVLLKALGPVTAVLEFWASVHPGPSLGWEAPKGTCPKGALNFFIEFH